MSHYCKSFQIDHQMNNEHSQQQWRVLSDGTVIHKGNTDLHRNYTFIINQTKQCASLRPNQNSFVIVVESDIINFDERQLIRDTWALNVLQRVVNYRVVFMVGLTHDQDIQVSFYHFVSILT